jgi:hypothetical protein
MQCLYKKHCLEYAHNSGMSFNPELVFQPPKLFPFVSIYFHMLNQNKQQIIENMYEVSILKNIKPK